MVALCRRLPSLLPPFQQQGHIVCSSTHPHHTSASSLPLYPVRLSSVSRLNTHVVLVPTAVDARTRLSLALREHPPASPAENRTPCFRGRKYCSSVIVFRPYLDDTNPSATMTLLSYFWAIDVLSIGRTHFYGNLSRHVKVSDRFQTSVAQLCSLPKNHVARRVQEGKYALVAMNMLDCPVFPWSSVCFHLFLHSFCIIELPSLASV